MFKLMVLVNFLSKFYLTIKVIKNLHIFVFDFFGLIKKKEVIYKTRNNLKFFARTKNSDKGEIVIVCAGSEYPKKFFPITKNPIVIDIGAHIGTFSAYLGRSLCINHPIVYAIEPDVDNFKYLTRNMKLNSFDFVKCFNLAIGRTNGVGYLDKTKESDGFTVSNEGVNDDVHSTDFVKCTLSTLDSFCDSQNISKIDLLKMDCEGCEYDIFETSIDFIRQNVKSIFVEVHNLDDKKNISKFKKILLNNNFSIEAEILERTFFATNLSIK